MPDHQVVDDAVTQARTLIDAGTYDDRTEWSDAAPSADDGNEQIEEHGWTGYAAWHLAVDPGADEETKKRHAFPYGDRPAAGSRRERASGGGQRVLLLLQRLDAKR
ncbi:hypothetical protein [Blastococcus saxobsidens]|uniref:Uncharacterized protein n=1 Tax=Blastococcus saxobsidens TaxID=138336 RepID=A0A4Q7Y5J8_9ACTN|nr:hypothetical protein [Blastococcus saxobsidens]RZU31704.1 hypothetical protein BKA19_1382 [Blastococcus saxobsidens]